MNTSNQEPKEKSVQAPVYSYQIGDDFLDPGPDPQPGQTRGNHWNERKRQSVDLSDRLKDIAVLEIMAEEGVSEDWARADIEKYEEEYYPFWYRKGEKVRGCARMLEFKPTTAGGLKLVAAWFCQDRLCAICNWRRALAYRVQLGKLVTVFLSRDIPGAAIFLTLTTRNVPAALIGAEITHLSQSVYRLSKYKVVAMYMLGGIRVIEITYNPDRDDYHIHVHWLVWMGPGYFRGQGYISQARWTELWQKAARLDYKPIVDVRKVRPRRTEDGDMSMTAAICETAKYPIKPDAFRAILAPVEGETPERRQHRADQVRALEEGMKNKRLITFSGVFRVLRAELKMLDPEDTDMIGEGDGGVLMDAPSIFAAYDFEAKKYRVAADPSSELEFDPWRGVEE